MDFKIFYCIVIVAANAHKITYEGYKVYNVVPKTENEVEVINEIKEKAIGETWEDYVTVNLLTKVMVSEQHRNEFLKIVTNDNIEMNETISDLQKAIEHTMKPAITRTMEDFYSMNWYRYYDLEDIYSWLDRLEAAFPNVAKTTVWGQSIEGRPLKGITIAINSYPKSTKLIAVIEAGIHAREWIGTATATWIIKEFLSSTNKDIRELAENFEWHILPVANPDGYSYSFTNNRLWRKNRNAKYNKSCASNIRTEMSIGADLNRNFDFHWNTIGASSDSCDLMFAGSGPFSEPESKAIADYVSQLHREGHIIYYLAFHSYSQVVLLPYGHVSSLEDGDQPDNYAHMSKIGKSGVVKLKRRFGTQYKVGLPSDLMYPTSGTSNDWVKYTVQAPVSILMEFRDRGEWAFLLPTEQIVPNCLEIMDFLLEMDKTTKSLGYYYSESSNAMISYFVLCSCIISVRLLLS